MHFSKPPVVEAVIDLDCDLVQSVNFQPKGQTHVAEQMDVLKLAFEGRYPRIRISYGVEGSVELQGEAPSSGSLRRNIRAYQLLSEDEKTIVQIRPNGFSFNRLSPYGSFDEYLPEIETAWSAFKAFATPSDLRLVRLRYINVIELPLVEGRVDMDEYITAGPQPPDIGGLLLSSFLNHMVAIQENTGHRISVALTTNTNTDKPPPPNVLSLLFDNSTEASVSLAPDDWVSIRAKLAELRGLKNQVFKSILTDKCRLLFQ